MFPTIKEYVKYEENNDVKNSINVYESDSVGVIPIEVKTELNKESLTEAIELLQDILKEMGE